MNAACSLILKKINDTKSDFHVLVKKFHSHVHWFHNDRQSKVKGQGKINNIVYITIMQLHDLAFVKIISV
jgi:hypothetical protein